MSAQFKSVELMSIMDSGHYVEMDYGAHSDVMIRIRRVEDDEPLADTEHVEYVEERFRDGDRIQYREIHQPGIDKLVSDREWTVNKQ